MSYSHGTMEQYVHVAIGYGAVRPCGHICIGYGAVGLSIHRSLDSEGT